MYGFDGCPEGKFKCKTKWGPRCLSEDWKCDYKEDCDDGADEANCETCNDKFWDCYKSGSNSKRCLKKSWRCDGQEDCEHGEDELGCDLPSLTANETRTNTDPSQPLELSSSTTTTPHTTTSSETTTTKTTGTTTNRTTTKTMLKQNNTTGLKRGSMLQRNLTEVAYEGSTNTSNLHSDQAQATEKNVIKDGAATPINGQVANDIETFVKDMLQSPIFVYSLISAVVVLILLLIATLCFLKRRKKQRQRRLPPIPRDKKIPYSPERQHLVSDSSSGCSSAVTASSIISDKDPSAPHIYEDIEKYAPSRLLLAQTGTQSWNKGCLEQTTGDSYYEIKNQSTDPSRNSSYAAVSSFTNDDSTAVTLPVSYYEQPRKQDKHEQYNGYQSIHELSVSQNGCADYEEPSLGYEEPVSCYRESTLGYDESGLKYGEPSSGYEEPINKSSKRDEEYNEINMNDDHIDVPMPALGLEYNCTGTTLAQPEVDESDYLRPVDDEYIHPV